MRAGEAALPLLLLLRYPHRPRPQGWPTAAPSRSRATSPCRSTWSRERCGPGGGQGWLRSVLLLQLLVRMDATPRMHACMHALPPRRPACRPHPCLATAPPCCLQLELASSSVGPGPLPQTVRKTVRAAGHAQQACTSHLNQEAHSAGGWAAVGLNVLLVHTPAGGQSWLACAPTSGPAPRPRCPAQVSGISSDDLAILQSLESTDALGRGGEAEPRLPALLARLLSGGWHPSWGKAMGCLD